jgi:hypothetical protein
MKIDLLQGMDGFSRVSPQPDSSVNGFSRVSYMNGCCNGYDLNGKRLKRPAPAKRPMVSSRVQPQTPGQITASLARWNKGVNGFILNGGYFLDFDIDPNTLQGRAERKARRSARKSKREARKSTRGAKKTERRETRSSRRADRESQKARRREARTVKKEKRSTRGEDRRSARLERQEARQLARTERQALRSEGGGLLSRLTDSASEIVSQVTGADDGFTPGGFIDEYLPEQLQPLAYEYLDDTGLLPPEIEEQYQAQKSKSAEGEEGGLPGWVLPVGIGAGALALIMFNKKKSKTKKRK